MASPSSELSLDCNSHAYSSLLLKSRPSSAPDHPVAVSGDLQTQKLQDFLARLEEERLKIDAFKRELPLCMQLLTSAMEASRQQLQSYRINLHGLPSPPPPPVLEEFIPINHISASIDGSDKTTAAAANISVVDNKANWMTSAQLWSQAAKETDLIGFDNGAGSKLGFDSKQRIGGAFLPFSKERNGCGPAGINPGGADLALAAAKEAVHEDKKYPPISEINNGKELSAGGGSADNGKSASGAVEGQSSAASGGNNSQTHRKARRCWSPDLHRRFVNALQRLGGSQAATPKQIRELMKVDGLTNDEVKSHLQKYRLHNRRPSPSPQTAGAPPPQLVVLGGIWVPPEYASAGGATPAIYGAASHAPSHYCASTPMPQDFYSSTQPAHHSVLHHHHHHHPQLHVYKPSSQGSPESGVRHGSESIEDGKTESGSGADGGEGKGLATLRDDGEESNATEITLKF